LVITTECVGQRRNVKERRPQGIESTHQESILSEAVAFLGEKEIEVSRVLVVDLGM
jgi:hypothetical protein